MKDNLCTLVCIIKGFYNNLEDFDYGTLLLFSQAIHNELIRRNKEDDKFI